MSNRLDAEALDQLFVKARTYRVWQRREVADATLKELVDLMEMGPTASNSLPARLIFVKSKEAKERLTPHLSEGNREKTMAAPVCAIIGYDLKFYEHLPKGMQPLDGFAGKADRIQDATLRNGSLQGAYLMMAARALGLDAGPMSGFDNAGVDREFFAEADIRSNFLCNIGYGDGSGMRARGPRFAFGDIAQIV
ncbi:MAG TPA: malonic semialdehyde reductase [Hyphomicrobiaceae bacterium]|jgi:3-hydroxypropanoate dehydrogenase|nr:malonic semialdehyde reductase [Hyphomicrobiaceae bacterium]